jgi:hypothetical protein
MKTLIAITLLLSVSVAKIAVAQTPPTENLAGRNFDEAREAELTQKSHRRLYPGGRDEADLKVQTPLNTPVRKLAPTGEAAAGEPSSED